MSPPNASIQSYFPPLPIPSRPSSSFRDGDGFTDEELMNSSPVRLDHWTPEKEYEKVDIGLLNGGLRSVLIQGRVVNFREYYSRNIKKHSAPAGFQRLIVRDDTGAICVKLWFARTPYKLRLGQLVSIWTTHISHGNGDLLTIPLAPLLTSLFPERERSNHIMLQENSDDGTKYRLPLTYNANSINDCEESINLPELMTLKNFLNGGHEVQNVRLLLCVKGVGARRKATTKKGLQLDVINIALFDDTDEVMLSLWGEMAFSASSWTASKTVLLISSPGWSVGKRAQLMVTDSTMIDIDPVIDDVEWLRAFATRLTQKRHPNPSIPEVFDFESFWKRPQKVLFTFADLDTFIRQHPFEHVIGFLCVVILDMNLVKYHRQQMLFSNECCGLSAYANSTHTECRHCNSNVHLRINPRVVGSLVDETGCTTAGKLILSDQAWTTLLGRTPNALASLTVDELRDIEQYILFSRVTLLFGWSAEDNDNGVGRLCIAEIRSF